MQFQQAEGQQAGLGAGGGSGGPDATLPPPVAMDFERAASFDDLLQANICYLRGELTETPYWCAVQRGRAVPHLHQRDRVRLPEPPA